MKRFRIDYFRIDSGFRLPSGTVWHNTVSLEAMFHIIGLWNGHQSHTRYYLAGEEC